MADGKAAGKGNTQAYPPGYVEEFPESRTQLACHFQYHVTVSACGAA